MLLEEEKKADRVALRISKKKKKLFEQAARLKGVSLTSYIISTVNADATETVEREYHISLTNETAKIFMEAIDAEPNEKLIEAAKRFKRLNR